MQLDSQFLRGTLDGVSVVGGAIPQDASFSIDSRTVCPGDIFVALAGKHYDGHDFIRDVCKKGAAGLVVEERRRSVLDGIDASVLRKMFVVVVEDTRAALIAWARSWRTRFTCPIVAVTGTVGKTSTKEIVASMLDLNGNTYLTSRGDKNTILGTALNLLRLRKKHEMAVFEVGVSKRGEMEGIADLLRPTNAVITNIGHQHMDGLGSLTDIALEKRKIFDYFTADRIGIINGDQSLLADSAYTHPVIKFGSKTTNQVQVRKMHVAGAHISFILKMYNERYSVVINQPHVGIVSNILAAASVAHLLGVPHDIIAQAASSPPVIAGRFELREIPNTNSTVIDDCYNVNPESLKAALTTFQNIETDACKVAVIGDMMGLGVNGSFWHRQIGRFIHKIPSLKKLILVGNLVKWIRKTAPLGIEVDCVETWQDAYALLNPHLVKGEMLVLVKGSRAMGLECLVDSLTGNTPSA